MENGPDVFEKGFAVAEGLKLHASVAGDGSQAGVVDKLFASLFPAACGDRPLFSDLHLFVEGAKAIESFPCTKHEGGQGFGVSQWQVANRVPKPPPQSGAHAASLAVDPEDANLMMLREGPDLWQAGFGDQGVGVDEEINVGLGVEHPFVAGTGSLQAGTGNDLDDRGKGAADFGGFVGAEIVDQENFERNLGGGGRGL